MIEKIVDFFISILPSSAFFYVFYLFIVVILSILIILLSTRVENKDVSNDAKQEITFEMLYKIAKNKNSTSKDLASALILFSENFNIKGNERGAFDFFKQILNHQNRNKEIFNIYQNKIVKKFSDYSKQLNEIERDALNK
ncbi:hypothetical protein FE773_06510 [Caminibacter mediatlanticus TB-2]|uniref:DUF4381 domain-containing protein n=1 Tax=Caminibacter mediatlanticus TB-2 TaxID=391592 RepID=A0ABX5V9G9_9BACT|nr:hypothetical protein [Caminibacter mediatlanticus]QCT94846.1 hypothetical protein FE773_06510 [Caminibacter mediatlanticus TB-2]